MIKVGDYVLASTRLNPIFRERYTLGVVESINNGYFVVNGEPYKKAILVKEEVGETLKDNTKALEEVERQVNASGVLTLTDILRIIEVVL